MGASTTTTKQESKSNPWSFAQPALKEMLNSGLDLYKTGQGFNPYGSSTVAGFSPETSAALGGIANTAQQGDPLGQAANQNAQNVIQSGGLNQGQWNALDGTYNVATGQNAITTGGQFQGLADQAGQPGAVSQNLSGYARGDYINGGSPQFNAALDYQSGKLSDDINRGFSGMGRYGSAAHAGSVGEQVGQFRNNALSSEIAREQGMQLQAAGMLSGEQNQGFANQLSALSGATGVQGQNINNILGAGQGYTGAVNQGQQLAANYTGMSPQIYQQLFAPDKMLGQAGSAYDAMNQAQLSDVVNRYDQTQQAPWNRLAALSGVALPAGQLGGTTKGTTSQTTPFNPLQAIGGVASSALPFFSSLTPSVANPYAGMNAFNSGSPIY